MTPSRQKQLLLAAQTVTPRTPERRKRYVIDRLGRYRPARDVAAYVYYMMLGGVPEKLWQEQ